MYTNLIVPVSLPVVCEIPESVSAFLYLTIIEKRSNNLYVPLKLQSFLMAVSSILAFQKEE